MDIEKLFNDGKELNRQYSFFINKNLLKYVGKNEDLVQAHVEKAKHNMLFFDKNKDDINFNDWLIVILYYALYHAVLALLANKQYSSKNHTASLIFLIKYYSHLKEDIKLMQELLIVKEDANLYTELKEDRHKASYKTQFSFSNDKINTYKLKVTNFIHKVEEIILNG